MKTYTTEDRHGYSVRFSPFASDHFLLATSQLYGLAGGGTLYLMEQNLDKGLCILQQWEWSDGLFDVAWCPCNENIAATASGDGTLQIWSLAVDPQGDNDELPFKTCAITSDYLGKKPLGCMKEHKNEVYSIDWGAQWNYNQVLSSSWDGSIKLWDCNRAQSLSTYNGKPLMSVHIPKEEILACDWSQFDRNLIFTGSSDGLVRAWDLRNMKEKIFSLYSGEFAVRRLACSPMAGHILASANYDFTTRIWDLRKSMEALEINTNHTEFVCGLDWNSNQQKPHQLADCGWDAILSVYTPESLESS